MYNSYICSTAYLRSKASSPSFSFNDNNYCCYLNNERIEKKTSSFSSCSCCAFPIHRVSTNPSFLYGFRQSTLIHWSASKRLILSGCDRYFRLPIYDLDRDCYGVSCINSSRSRRRIRRIRVWEEEGERFDSSVLEDAEAMLSLLSEVVDENCVDVRERNGRFRSGGRVKVEKRDDLEEEKESVRTNSSERNLKCGFGSVALQPREGRFRSGSVQVEKRNDWEEEKENVGMNSSKRNSKCGFESVTLQSREEEEYARSEGRGRSSLRSENRGPRKEGSRSSCSSYYSFSASGDMENDENVWVEQEEFVGESYSGNTKAFGRYAKGSLERESVERLKRDEDDVGWDSRNNAEKEIIKVLVGQTRSRKESLHKHSRISKIHDSDKERGSSSHFQFTGWEANSSLMVNFEEGAREQHNEIGHRVIERSQSRSKSEQRTKMSETQDFGFTMDSSSQKRISDKGVTEASNLVSKTSGGHGNAGHQLIGQDGSRKKAQQLTEMSNIHDIDIERTSSTQRQSKTRTMNRKENSTVLLSSVQEAKEQPIQNNDWVVGPIESSRTTQQFTGRSEIYEVVQTPTLQKQSRTKRKGEEENFTSVPSLVPEATEHCIQSDQNVIRKNESSKESQYIFDMSTSHATDIEAVSNSQGIFETRMSSFNRNSTSVEDLVKEERERHKETSEEIMEQHTRKESQVPIRRLSSWGSTSEEASISRASLNLVQQATGNLLEVQQEEDERDPQVVMTPPPSQLVARRSAGVEATSGYARQEVSRGTSESGAGTLYTGSQGMPSASLHKLDSGTRRDETYGEPLELIFPEDALGSANRLENFSTQFVGEFADQLRHEASTSKIEGSRTSSETILAHKDDKYTQQGSSQLASEDFQSKVHTSSRPSAAKGPSDEMWDVAGPSSQEPLGTEATEEETSTIGGTIIRKTGRSLWSIIADVVRLRWGVRAEAHNSTVKSGGKSSSNESAGSEAWFSGHEHDENDNENIKGERRGMPKELGSSDQTQIGISPAQSQGEASDATSSQEKIRQVEVDTSFSSGFLEKDSPSKGAFSASGEDHFGLKEDGKRGQEFPSNVAEVDSSMVPARRLMSESSKVEVLEQPVRERLIEPSETKGKDSELKQRKLQRNKQVPKERFEEWEEAYKLESEQRRLDEMFMREALVEAKKAADTWEVPVGAVLAQHGKIIARGCNLVEESRDSTAHAEMICIREASNLLRTWRLAETTLYVTLEPCAMCAGAILQARIDTVVWGAPNKLLGADGSWVRLFPGEGGSSSDLANQPAGPVHPFHPKMTVRRGVLATDCGDVMQQFFHLRRKKEKKPEPSTPPPSCLPISTHPSKFLSKMHDIFSIMFCL